MSRTRKKLRLILKPARKRLRKIVLASESGPAYNWIWNIIDRIPLRKGDLIPPKHLLGLWDRDYDAYSNIGKEFLTYFIDLCDLRPYNDVLEVGCGIGKSAVQLANYLLPGVRYEGLDIIPAGINWCKRKITPRHPNFQFSLVDVYNREYNPDGRTRASEYKFPYEDRSFDFVFLVSVFTHMLPQDVKNYLSEISRVLRSNGRCLITFFLLNDQAKELIALGLSTLDFRYVMNGYRSINPNVAERAVGYEEVVVRELCRNHGLRVLDPIRYGSWPGRKQFLSYQDILIATKA